MGRKRKIDIISSDINVEVANTNSNEIVAPEVLKEVNKGYSSFEFDTYLLGTVTVNHRGHQLISIFKDGLNIMNNICHYDYIEIISIIRKG